MAGGTKALAFHAAAVHSAVAPECHRMAAPSPAEAIKLLPTHLRQEEAVVEHTLVGCELQEVWLEAIPRHGHQQGATSDMAVGSVTTSDDALVTVGRAILLGLHHDPSNADSQLMAGTGRDGAWERRSSTLGARCLSGAGAALLEGAAPPAVLRRPAGNHNRGLGAGGGAPRSPVPDGAGNTAGGAPDNSPSTAVSGPDAVEERTGGGAFALAAEPEATESFVAAGAVDAEALAAAEEEERVLVLPRNGPRALGWSRSDGDAVVVPTLPLAGAPSAQKPHNDDPLAARTGPELTAPEDDCEGAADAAVLMHLDGTTATQAALAPVQLRPKLALRAGQRRLKRAGGVVRLAPAATQAPALPTWRGVAPTRVPAAAAPEPPALPPRAPAAGGAPPAGAISSPTAAAALPFSQRIFRMLPTALTGSGAAGGASAPSLSRSAAQPLSLGQWALRITNKGGPVSAAWPQGATWSEAGGPAGNSVAVAEPDGVFAVRPGAAGGAGPAEGGGALVGGAPAHVTLGALVAERVAAEAARSGLAAPQGAMAPGVPSAAAGKGGKAGGDGKQAGGGTGRTTRGSSNGSSKQPADEPPPAPHGGKGGKGGGGRDGGDGRRGGGGGGAAARSSMSQKYPKWMLDNTEATREQVVENLSNTYVMTASVLCNNQHEKFFVRPEVPGANGRCMMHAPEAVAGGAGTSASASGGGGERTTTMLVAFNPRPAGAREYPNNSLALEDMYRATSQYEAWGVYVVVADGRELHESSMPVRKKKKANSGAGGDSSSLHERWTEPLTHGGLVTVPAKYQWFGLFEDGANEPWAYLNLYTAVNGLDHLEVLILDPSGRHRRTDFFSFINSCKPQHGESEFRGAIIIWRSTKGAGGKGSKGARREQAKVWYDVLQLKDVHHDNPLFSHWVRNPINQADFPSGAIPPLYDAPIKHLAIEKWENMYQ